MPRKESLSDLALDALEVLTHGPIPVFDLAELMTRPDAVVTPGKLGPALAALARRGLARSKSELVERRDGKGTHRISLYALAHPDWSIVDAPENRSEERATAL